MVLLAWMRIVLVLLTGAVVAQLPNSHFTPYGVTYLQPQRKQKTAVCLTGLAEAALNNTSTLVENLLEPLNYGDVYIVAPDGGKKFVDALMAHGHR